ncbi:MAG: hypothetical protein J6Y57_01165 [Lachnospiraceae bacterium]|nr:hypothetical protein [Lachnospiraceae bacterium]
MAFYRSKRASGGGGQTRVGTGTYNGTREITINLGFKPKYLALTVGTSGKVVNVYNADLSTTQFYRQYGSYTGSWQDIGTTSYAIKSITDTGFSVVGYSNASATFYYFAIG